MKKNIKNQIVAQTKEATCNRDNQINKNQIADLGRASTMTLGYGNDWPEGMYRCMAPRR